MQLAKTLRKPKQQEPPKKLSLFETIANKIKEIFPSADPKQDFAEYESKSGTLSKEEFIKIELDYFQNKEKYDSMFRRMDEMRGIKKQPKEPGQDKPKRRGGGGSGRTLTDAEKQRKIILRQLYEKYGKQAIDSKPQDIIPGRYGKDKISLAREDLTQFAVGDYVPEKLKGILKDHQKDFINLATENFKNGKKGVINMDGTGTGKTMQQLGLAYTKLQENPNAKILIVTKDDNIIDDAFTKDSKFLGLEINKVKQQNEFKQGINVTTYSALAKRTDQDYDMVIFDESQLMKNKDSKTSHNGEIIIGKSKNVALFSATPGDKPEHISYVAKALGLNSKKIADDLKFRMEIVNGKPKKVYLTPFETADKIAILFDDITKKGLTVKREVPQTNVNMGIENIEFTPEFQKEYDKVSAVYEKMMQDDPSTTGMALMSMNRFTERGKVAHTVKLIQESIQNNRKIVIFAECVNESKFKGLSKKTPGTLELLSAELEKLGIKFGKIYGGRATKEDEEDINNSIKDFQTGDLNVILATSKSGGTGISLDDTVGDKPRDMVIMTAPYSANEVIQDIGRINRLNTKSVANVKILKSKSFSDSWTTGIIANKLKTLGAQVGGDYAKMDIDEMDRISYMTSEEKEKYFYDKKMGNIGVPIKPEPPIKQELKQAEEKTTPEPEPVKESKPVKNIKEELKQTDRNLFPEPDPKTGKKIKNKFFSNFLEPAQSK